MTLVVSELPAKLMEIHGLGCRIYQRGGEPEVRFLFRDAKRFLPVWLDGQLQIVRWGNRRGQSKALPLTAWTREETLQAGGWENYDPVKVAIPTTMGLDNGIWYRVRQGVRGIVVKDENDQPVVYVLVEQSSHYYRIMTRSPWMPVMIGERI